MANAGAGLRLGGAFTTLAAALLLLSSCAPGLKADRAATGLLAPATSAGLAGAVTVGAVTIAPEVEGLNIKPAALAEALEASLAANRFLSQATDASYALDVHLRDGWVDPYMTFDQPYRRHAEITVDYALRAATGDQNVVWTATHVTRFEGRFKPTLSGALAAAGAGVRAAAISQSVNSGPGSEGAAAAAQATASRRAANAADGVSRRPNHSAFADSARGPNEPSALQSIALHGATRKNLAFLILDLQALDPPWEETK